MARIEPSGFSPYPRMTMAGLVKSFPGHGWRGRRGYRTGDQRQGTHQRREHTPQAFPHLTPYSCDTCECRCQ